MKKIALASGALIILLCTVSLLMALTPSKVNELQQKAQQAIKASQYTEAQKHIDALRTAKEFRVAEPLEIELLKNQLAAAQTKAPEQPAQDDALARLMAENEQLKSEITSLKEQPAAPGASQDELEALRTALAQEKEKNKELQNELAARKAEPATPGASADELAALREQLKKANDELVAVKDQLQNAYSAETVNHMQALAHELVSMANMAAFKVGQAQTATALGRQEEALQGFQDAHKILFDLMKDAKDELAQMISGGPEDLGSRIKN